MREREIVGKTELVSDAVNENKVMEKKCAVMLEMQDAMNSRVDPDWIERDREWYRAIWIECAELMDHYGGWKWWKASSPDIEQVMLEIVDIWHFGLSTRITADRDYARAATEIVAEWQAAAPPQGFLEDVERLANTALSERTLNVGLIPRLLTAIDRGFDDLYESYVGKNVLNFFRQDHGYREGSYVKTWQGREDNEHLVEILAALDSDDDRYREAIYEGLVTRYPVSDS